MESEPVVHKADKNTNRFYGSHKLISKTWGCLGWLYKIYTNIFNQRAFSLPCMCVTGYKEWMCNTCMWVML